LSCGCAAAASRPTGTRIYWMVARCIGPSSAGPRGVIDRIWADLMDDCAELGSVDWEQQAADGVMGKARLGGSCRPQPHRPSEARAEAQLSLVPSAIGAIRRNKELAPCHPQLDSSSPRH
jgi:hypothetical protein